MNKLWDIHQRNAAQQLKEGTYDTLVNGELEVFCFSFNLKRLQTVCVSLLGLPYQNTD